MSQRPCPPLGLVPHCFPSMEAPKFGPSPILVPLFCDLKNHGIIGSDLPGGSFLIVNLIKQGHMLVVRTTMIF
jgi:hypothetical protein